MDGEVDVDRHFGVQRRVFKVSLGTVKWYRSSYGTDYDNSEVAGPV